MNVLMIGMDPSPAKKGNGGIGDLRERLEEYGKGLSTLFVISHSPRTRDYEITHFSNVTVIPTKSVNRFFFLLDGYRIGSRLIKNEKSDIITVQDPILAGIIGYALKKRFALPLIVQLHGDYIDNPYWIKKNKINRFLNSVGKFILKRADSVRVVSERVKKKVLKLGVSDERIYKIPVFINTENFTSKSTLTVREKFSNFNDIVLFVGRLSDEKNVNCLLQAADLVLEQFPDTLFLIVGDGPERKNLENFATELEIEKNVIFEGAIEHKKIPLYYNSCDMFVLPSKREGRSIAIVEALACGKPVISTNISGAEDVILNGENGFIVSIDDSQAMADRISSLVADPQRRDRMGKKGKAGVIETQDIKKNSYKLKEMYEKVVELSR